MIVQSPESEMSEPFKTWVRQRSESIARVLKEVVGDSNVQLCPRAITPDEQIFPEATSCVYGVVVREKKDGYKSILYTDNFGHRHGITTSNPEDAVTYVTSQIRKGNRVRMKDPRESDSQGQHTVESVDQMMPIFEEIVKNTELGCVFMPYLPVIRERISVGRIVLGQFGAYTYFGREETTLRDNTVVYGGTELGLFRSNMSEAEISVRKHFGIPPKLTDLGKTALDRYSRVAISIGRVSVDVIEGITDSGETICDVIDLTPRAGGTTPAEILAIREIHQGKDSPCYASSKLIYNPNLNTRPKSGINFIDTDTLIVNGQIQR